ncbi:hypothetical protein ACSBR2_039368 [Camellia fascicularis]
MVEAEITVGFDNEVLAIREQLAGGKGQLEFVSIVGMPGLDIDMSNEKLGEMLYKNLKGKRYIIVIDDIWDIGAWVDLKMYLPNDIC